MLLARNGARIAGIGSATEDVRDAMAGVSSPPPYPRDPLRAFRMHEYLSWISGAWVVVAVGFLVTANRELTRPDR